MREKNEENSEFIYEFEGYFDQPKDLADLVRDVIDDLCLSGEVIATRLICVESAGDTKFGCTVAFSNKDDLIAMIKDFYSDDADLARREILAIIRT